jgi:hypothetical protein
MPDVTPDAGTLPQPQAGGVPETQSPAPAPQADNTQLRLNGALAKIQELTLSNQNLTAQLAQKDQQIASLSSESAVREAGLKTQASEHLQGNATLTAENARLTTELQTLRAFKLKAKIANELAVPGIFEILDVIPDAADEAAQKAVMERFSKFAGNISQAREAQLLAGNTGPASIQSTTTAPSTPDGWSELVNKLPLGSPERADAMKKWQAAAFK